MTESNLASHRSLGGIILAGGKSRRMGRDKASLRLNGRTFVEQLISTFQSADVPVVVVKGAADASLSDTSLSDTNSENNNRLFFVCDQRPDAGPLEGIRVGLASLAPVAEFGFVISCDSPLLKIDFVQYLLAGIQSFQAIVPQAESKVYGTTAIYRTDIHPLIGRELRSGIHSVKKMLGRLDVQFVDTEELRAVDPDLVSLININTRDEYKRIRSQFEC